MNNVIRYPIDEELLQCVQLILVSGPKLYPYIFPTNEEKLKYLILKLMQTKGMYSKDNIKIEVETNKIRGLILAYPARNMKQMIHQMIKYIPTYCKILGPIQLTKMVIRLQFNKYFPKIYNDEYFVSNIAVSEEYRGKGIASSLLQNIEQDAQSKGISKISLFVEIENSKAIDFYRKNKYSEITRIELPARYNKYNLFGFIKMMKEIPKKVLTIAST